MLATKQVRAFEANRLQRATVHARAVGLLLFARLFWGATRIENSVFSAFQIAATTFEQKVAAQTPEPARRDF